MTEYFPNDYINTSPSPQSPQKPFGQQTNKFIQFLHLGVVLARIYRRFFTHHGMYLSMKGKDLLAKLLCKAVIRAGGAETTPPTHSPPPAYTIKKTNAPAESVVLLQDTFTHAVNRTPATEEIHKDISVFRKKL